MDLPLRPRKRLFQSYIEVARRWGEVAVKGDSNVVI